MIEKEVQAAVEEMLDGNIARLYIRKKTDRRTFLELMAEEAAELSQACLKCIRAEGLNNNPTPVAAWEAQRNLQEEWEDVQRVGRFLNLQPISQEDDVKVKRWLYRMIQEEVLQDELCKKV